jgi:predicted DsbA family dithiol-disulfide isomerase
MDVEIWSDVVCPWCAIGRARFQRAVAEHPRGDEVSVRWRSFELDPQAPREREGDYTTMLATKYRTSPAEAQAMIDRMVATAADEDLHFDFTIARPGNTFDAHRVLHLAADRGLQDAVKERFLRGYHSEGEAIGTHEAVQRLAVDAGLDEVEVKSVLEGDAYADAVRADEAQAVEYGISGVPFFVVDGRYAVSGAQSVEVITAALDKAWPTPQLLTVDAADAPGDSCGVEGC